MKLILPHRGEFGLRLRFAVPAAHYIATREPTIVCVERGCEALYPAAYAFKYVDSPPDDARRGLNAKGVPEPEVEVPDGVEVVRVGKGMPEERFVPEPWETALDWPADVVICPRLRNYGSAKNWDAWPDVAARIELGAHTFIAGLPETSYSCLGTDKAWKYDRPLDVTIEAMRSCKLVIATDAGLAHLAVLCGAPLLIVTYQGRVAPGPVIDGDGRQVYDQYWPVRLDEYYHAANHTGSMIETIDGWEHPERVVERALEIVG